MSKVPCSLQYMMEISDKIKVYFKSVHGNSGTNKNLNIGEWGALYMQAIIGLLDMNYVRCSNLSE